MTRPARAVLAATALSPLLVAAVLGLSAWSVERLFRYESGELDAYVSSVGQTLGLALIVMVAPVLALVAAQLTGYVINRDGVLRWCAVWLASLVIFFWLMPS